MKIGILTYQRSQNYGALLQAYGLQQYVSSLGHDTRLIDYWPNYHEEMYKPFSWQKFKALDRFGKLRYIKTLFFTCVRLHRRRKNTSRFISQFLNISLERKYDLVIYGSDQIWRKQHQPTYEWYNPVYFGEGYVQTPYKIAYAASMGKIEVDSEKDFNFIQSSLKNFNEISIREQDLIDFFSKRLGINYKLVCDPVFLLTKFQWLEALDKKYIPNYKYIFYYRLQGIKDTDLIVEELAKKTGLPIIELRGYVPAKHYGKRYRFTANAQEFITLLNGAEYVVTSAFHGIAMSLIFEKQFYYASQKSQANRVESLLSIVGLLDRIKGNDGFEITPQKMINYEFVSRSLNEFAEDSRQWLKRNIEICAE